MQRKSDRFNVTFTLVEGEIVLTKNDKRLRILVGDMKKVFVKFYEIQLRINWEIIEISKTCDTN